MRRLSFLVLLLLLAGNVNARVTVLAHGYLGSPVSWLNTGIVAQLQHDGHIYRGSYGTGPHGVLLQAVPGADQQPGNSVYTVSLPSRAPILHQANWLAAYLRDISLRHPGEAVSLVGHSAGGLVARAMLVRNGTGNVDQLVTIAAPHLGTSRAIQALDATSNGGMFGWLKDFVVRQSGSGYLYDTVQSSRGVLLDLTPAGRPGSLLYWLNAQVHPDLSYVSVIRSAGFNLPGDRVVPAFSQDLNNVRTLAGKAKALLTYAGHELAPPDGRMLLGVLKK